MKVRRDFPAGTFGTMLTHDESGYPIFVEYPVGKVFCASVLAFLTARDTRAAER
jgi:hypothetical protein